MPYGISGNVSIRLIDSNRWWFAKGLDSFSVDFLYIEVKYTTGRDIPDAPSDLTVTKENGSVVLNWSDNSDNESGFEIQRKVRRKSWTTLAAVGADSNSYVDENPEGY